MLYYLLVLNPNTLASESDDRQQKEAQEVEVVFRPTEQSSGGKERERIRSTRDGVYADANNTNTDGPGDAARVEVELVKGGASDGIPDATLTASGTGSGSPRVVAIANALGRKKEYSPIAAESV